MIDKVLMTIDAVLNGLLDGIVLFCRGLAIGTGIAVGLCIMLLN